MNGGEEMETGKTDRMISELGRKWDIPTTQARQEGRTMEERTTRHIKKGR